MIISQEVSNLLKAKNFLGFLSLRNVSDVYIVMGIFVVSFSQLLFGVSLYCTLHYLHPSLLGVAWFLLGLHVFVSFLGFFGAFSRSRVMISIYLVFYAISLVFVFMIALDMSELVHFLPKAPQMDNFSLFSVYTPLITKFKTPNSNILFPLNFYKQTYASNSPYDHSFHSVFDKEKLSGNYSLNEIDLHSHKNCPNTSMHRTREGPFNANDPNGSMDNLKDLNDLRNALKQKIKEVSNSESSQNSDTLPNSNSDYGSNPVSSPNPDQKQDSTPNQVPVSDTSNNQKTEEKKDSFYDHIPFLPHPGETEGESEEVSKDEFPPETKDLTPEGKSEVVVMYKMQKRSVKFAVSALLLLSLLFYVYGYWITLTFVYNHCSDKDVLISQPDQFVPIED